MKPIRFFVNIDHVATVRQARRTDEPDPVRAAVVVELGGADGLTVHLREDRRHIQNRDVDLLMLTARTPVNLEMAVVDDVVTSVCAWAPDHATIVPERREEVTTEGGLDAAGSGPALKAAIMSLTNASVPVSLFIAPDDAQIRAALDLGAVAIELHTGRYADTSGSERRSELQRLVAAAELATSLGLKVHAGHGLTYENVTAVASIPDVEELNIGHSIVARALFSGLQQAVSDMRAILLRARGARV